MDERHREAMRIFDLACSLSETERVALLRRECADDHDLCADVESLLAHHVEIDPPTSTGVPRLVGFDVDGNAAAPQLPDRIGPYRIIRQIGRGGMGVVYQAVHEGDHFKRHVAIKVLRRGLDTEDLLRRFEIERQLLAALNHPCIARLYDGGQTSDGLPYFAMEYVEGQPIDDYCDTHRLRIDERLELFRQVCGAVHHAHQNLVVHRDLKPSNIVVGRDNTPKLLDFGIAKLINPEMALFVADPTAPDRRFMTPEYSSPEQVRGAPITTASDIYSLGVLLYELVTGHRPYRIKNCVQAEIERIICQVDPERPSTAVGLVEEVPAGRGTTTITPELVSQVREGKPERLRRRLAGDIDNIVLMAMRKEPQRRYKSAEQFSEDIRRHLDGLPVIARRDTAVYRGVKFVGRHRVGVVAAAAIVVLLVTGIAGTSYGMVTARQERDAAQAERERAERMFGETLDLAHAFIFEFNDRIAPLEGSTDARVLLVETALECLDGLRRDVGDDAELMRELASAYDKVGSIRGGFRNPNLGDTSGALESFRTGLQMREELLAARPDDAELKQHLSLSHMHVGDVLRVSGDVAGALKEYETHLKLIEPLAGRYRRLYNGAVNNVATMLERQGDLEATQRLYSRALATRTRLLEANPADLQAQRDVSVSQLRMGGILVKIGQYQRGIDHYEETIRIRSRLVETDPQNSRYRRDLAFAHYFAADALLDLGRSDEAASHAAKCMPALEQRAASDPLDRRSVFDLAAAYEINGRVQAASGEMTAALDSYEKAEVEIDARVANDPANATNRAHLAEIRSLRAQALRVSGGDAEHAYRRALDTIRPITLPEEADVRHREQLGEILSGLGEVLIQKGELNDAHDTLERALSVYRALAERQPRHTGVRLGLAETLYRIARLKAELGYTNEAGDLADEALEELSGAPEIPRTAELRRNIKALAP